MRSFSIILDDTIAAIIVQVLRLRKIYLLICFFFFFFFWWMKLQVICFSPDGTYLSNTGRKYKFANGFVCLIHLRLQLQSLSISTCVLGVRLVWICISTAISVSGNECACTCNGSRAQWTDCSSCSFILCCSYLASTLYFLIDRNCPFFLIQEWKNHISSVQRDMEFLILC